MYQDIIATAKYLPVIDGLEILAQERLSHLGELHPHLPKDYLFFLAEIGWGVLGNDHFWLYGGPIEAAEIYGSDPDLPMDLLLVGDDLSGFNVGFLKGDSRVVEVNSASRSLAVVATSFARFIREKIETLSEIVA